MYVGKNSRNLSNYSSPEKCDRFWQFLPSLELHIQTFLIPLFFPFWKRVYYRTLCQTPPQRETTHFLFENSSSDCSEQIRAAKNSFLGESKMVKKKTTEPPRLLKNRYAPSFPPNLLSITNLIGAAGDVLLLLLQCSCLPPPIFLYIHPALFWFCFKIYGLRWVCGAS